MSVITNLLAHPYVEVIKYYEGFYEKAYLCPAGKWTIGWGHLCEKGHPLVDRTQAELYLVSDLLVALSGLRRLAPQVLADAVNPHRAAALMSWVFNLGESNLESSTMLKRIREEKWEAAAAEMLRWNKATDPRTGVKRELEGLTKRRRSEAHCFLTGECKKF